MNIKEIFEYWKAILALIILVVTATFSILAWAEDQKAQMRAEQHLIHNEQYQEGRIERKRNTIIDNVKLIEAIEADDDEPSLDEQKLVTRLREENIRLEADIEEIRAQLATKHE